MLDLPRHPSTRVAAITGLGIVSSLGCTLGDVSMSLRAGRSGIGIDPERHRHGFRSALSGLIRGFDPKQSGMTRRSLRTTCEPARYAHSAVRDAILDAHLEPEELRNPRCGIVFGNDSTVKPAVESIDIVREHGSSHFIGGSHIFRAMNSTITMNLAAIFGFQGASWTMSAACASGAHAIGQAATLIRSGLQDVVVAGGAQETNWMSMTSFDALGVFSRREDEPEQASRPFDRDRDGLVPSGGAAALIIEDLDHARARGARVYGVVRGFGFSSDGCGHLFVPDAEGTAQAMKMALEDADVRPDDVDYVNAHATSTPAGDLAEARAIAAVLGTRAPVSSTKSLTGHECWMAGASEVVYTTLMARDGFMAGNLNFSGFDEETPPINVLADTASLPMRIAVSNSFGFGGTNAVLVCEFGSNPPTVIRDIEK